MKFSILLVLAISASAEMLDGLLGAGGLMGAGGLKGGGGLTDVISGVMDKDSKMLIPKDEGGTSSFKTAEPMKFATKPVFVPVPKVKGPSMLGTAKVVKMAAPVKALGVKKAVTAKVLAVPKIKAVAAVAPIAKALKKKPKATALKPIVYVVEKKVPVYHKVPVPKKVMVPKFYPVYKPIPYPKIVPVPFKVPVKKIIPKIVKIPKAVPVPKFVAVKKPVPIPIPYPVPKFVKFPVKKPVPYAKYIPIPIPKKVPKFIPVPVKKIIKVPKPYYVPIKVPHFTTSYVKTPMGVNVPDMKKPSFGGGKLSVVKKPSMGLPKLDDDKFKFLDSDLNKSNDGKSMLGGSFPGMGDEDQELLKLLAGTLPGGDQSIKI